MIRRALLWAVLFLLPVVARAQCVPPGGGPATIASCPDAVDLQPDDYVLAMQKYNGTTITTQPGSTRKATPLQLAQSVGASGTGGGSAFNTTFPANGTAVGAKNGANMVPLLTDGPGNLMINCVNCASGAGAPVSAVDGSSFTPGVTTTVPAAGYYQTTPTNNGLVSGQMGAFQVTQTRGLFVNLRNAAGTELGVAGSPLQNNIAQINGVAPLMGNGVTGTGSQRVTIASDQTPLTFIATQPVGANLHFFCDGGCSSSTAPADASAFTFGTTSQTPIGGVFQTTATANPLATGQMGAFQVTANRALFTNLRTSAGVETGTAASPLQVSLANTALNGTALAVTLPANQSVNLTQVAGVAPAQGHGVAATALRVELPTDGTGTVGLIAGSATVGKVNLLGNVGGTLDFPGQNAASPANSVMTGCQFNTAPTTVTSGNATPVQCDSTGRQIVAQGAGPWTTNQTQLNSTAVSTNAGAADAGTQRVTVATAGETPFREIVPANTTSVAVKAGAGVLYDLDGFSVPASTLPVFVKFYNTAQGGVTCGTPAPVLGPYMIPPAGTGFVKSWAQGINFSTAITMCVTGGQADNDTTAPTAAQYTVNVGFK